MNPKDVRDALRNIEDVALAYTVKTSNAETHEQFLDDYLLNLKAFKEIAAQNKRPWAY